MDRDWWPRRRGRGGFDWLRGGEGIRRRSRSITWKKPAGMPRESLATQGEAGRGREYGRWEGAVSPSLFGRAERILKRAYARMLSAEQLCALRDWNLNWKVPIYIRTVASGPKLLTPIPHPRTG